MKPKRSSFSAWAKKTAQREIAAIAFDWAWGAARCIRVTFLSGAMVVSAQSLSRRETEVSDRLSHRPAGHWYHCVEGR